MIPVLGPRVSLKVLSSVSKKYRVSHSLIVPLPYLFLCCCWLVVWVCLGAKSVLLNAPPSPSPSPHPHPHASPLSSQCRSLGFSLSSDRAELNMHVKMQRKLARGQGRSGRSSRRWLGRRGLGLVRGAAAGLRPCAVLRLMTCCAGMGWDGMGWAGLSVSQRLTDSGSPTLTLALVRLADWLTRTGREFSAFCRRGLQGGCSAVSADSVWFGF